MPRAPMSRTDDAVDELEHVVVPVETTIVALPSASGQTAKSVAVVQCDRERAEAIPDVLLGVRCLSQQLLEALLGKGILV